MNWAIPEALGVPPDQLRFRLDFYHDSIVATQVESKKKTTKLVSADALASVMAREANFSSGLLPENVLWWRSGKEGPEWALWYQPQVWRVALVQEAFQPLLRFALPMPGLIFICRPVVAPWCYAATHRPVAVTEYVYHAPLFNVFQSGRTCPGTQKFSRKIEEIPLEFFKSLFTRAGDSQGRSKKHQKSLLNLWSELDGKARYPLKDLVRVARVENLLEEREMGYRRWNVR